MCILFGVVQLQPLCCINPQIAVLHSNKIQIQITWSHVTLVPTAFGVIKLKGLTLTEIMYKIFDFQLISVISNLQNHRNQLIACWKYTSMIRITKVYGVILRRFYCLISDFQPVVSGRVYEISTSVGPLEAWTGFRILDQTLDLMNY